MHQPDLLDCALPADEAIAPSLAAPGVAGSEVRASRGRRPVHADGAARKRAHRAGKARIDYTDKPEIAQTIADLADQFGVSRNEVMQSLTRFALTNRNWKQVGLYGARRDGVLQ